ncbi:MAG: hypothetical protein ACK5LX_01600 [Oscillospiraceae bacterium]
MCIKTAIVTRLTALMLPLLLLACLIGCREQGGTPAEESRYSQLGIEESVPLKMLLIGDEPSDLALVQEALDEQLLDKINATLSIQYLPWADYKIKYEIVLASAEQLDLVYTSDWCFYQREAVRGSFYELTDDFTATYLPNALANTPPEAILQAKIGGKLYMMPKSSVHLEGESWIAIRGDLREKYGLPPVKNVDDLETYFKLVAENEEDIIPYDASGEVPLFPIFGMHQYNMALIPIGSPWITRYRDEEHIPDPSEIDFLYMTPEYEDFVLQMKQYADWGFWAKYALSSENRPIESFERGTSASLVWNQTIFTAGENLCPPSRNGRHAANRVY